MIKQRKEFQYEKVLRLLEIKPMTTIELAAQFIPAPQKSIQILRGKGYLILTEDIPNYTHKKYTLAQEPIISNVVNGQCAFIDVRSLEAVS